jgi:phospho-N-acetylmuramoyl-pentapeptide-transferase
LLVLSACAIAFSLQGNADILKPLALTIALAVFNGMIGFFDDYRKLVKKENQGLSFMQKILLQSLAAILYIIVMVKTESLDTVLHIPFTTTIIELGWLYYVFAFIFIVGMVNSVNLTDGIDGLASSVTLIIGLFLAVIAFNNDNLSLTLISASAVGATTGFLMYNAYPARVFMGDTGSLFLGGLVTGAAFMMNEPLIISIAGFIYVIEAFSVMIQVGVYKLTKKRVFKMAPIHHHFEKCGWSERKIVAVFSFLTVIFCVIAWFSINQ